MAIHKSLRPRSNEEITFSCRHIIKLNNIIQNNIKEHLVYNFQKCLTLPILFEVKTEIKNDQVWNHFQ